MIGQSGAGLVQWGKEVPLAKDSLATKVHSLLSGPLISSKIPKSLHSSAVRKHLFNSLANCLIPLSAGISRGMQPAIAAIDPGS